MSAKSTVTVLGVVTVLLIGGAFVALPVLAQDGGDGVELPPKQDGGDYDCGQFDNREQVEAVFNPNDDQYRLDGDGDGVACESVGEPTDEQPTDDKQTEDKKDQTETKEEDKKKEEMKDEKKEEKQDDEMKEDKKDEKKDKQMDEKQDEKKEEMNDEKKDDTEDDHPPC